MATNDKPDNQALNESLSALVDAEATELELRRLLASMESAPELRERWHRYHLAGAALKGNLSLAQPVDLSLAIAAAVEKEPHHALKPQAKSVALWKNIGRFSVAASVAGALILGVQLHSTTDNGLDVADGRAVSGSLSPTPQLGNTSVRTVSQGSLPEPATQRRQPIVISEQTQQQLRQVEGQLGRLMLEHAQDAAQNTQHGVLPYVRVPETNQ
ncbi:MAG: sigma-E factor negative regulatory protein [Cellvibrionaceae bacterium]|nr:sigma-E factor negative regulatory protein [Cellvibrionaceae bacterium]